MQEKLEKKFDQLISVLSSNSLLLHLFCFGRASTGEAKQKYYCAFLRPFFISSFVKKI